MVVKWIASVSVAVLAAQAALVAAQEAAVQTVAAAVPEFRADEIFEDGTVIPANGAMRFIADDELKISGCKLKVVREFSSMPTTLRPIACVQRFLISQFFPRRVEKLQFWEKCANSANKRSMAAAPSGRNAAMAGSFLVTK